MKPADALAYREMFCSSTSHVSRKTCDCPDNPDGSPDVPECPHDRWIDHVKGLARTVPIYFVSDEMTDIALAASRTMPARVPPDALPSRTGFLLFTKPMGSDTDDESEPSSDLPVICWDADFIYPVLYRRTRTWSFPGRLRWAELSQLADLPHPLEEGIASVRPFLAAALLMQQKLAIAERGEVPRPLRRRMARLCLPAAVKVIKWRRLEHRPSGDGELVAWSHRWLVNGHWRQQWYPSTSEHRPMWISPHVKGPADKPFVPKERVIAWVR